MYKKMYLDVVQKKHIKDRTFQKKNNHIEERIVQRIVHIEKSSDRR